MKLTFDRAMSFGRAGGLSSRTQRKEDQWQRTR